MIGTLHALGGRFIVKTANGVMFEKVADGRKADGTEFALVWPVYEVDGVLKRAPQMEDLPSNQEVNVVGGIMF